MKKVIVTTSWDDGHILDLKLVRLLNKYKLAGTLYISPFDREMDKKKLLTSSQVKKVMSKKIEIGAHTMTHPRLPDVNIKEANLEIINSKKYLEKIIGKSVKSFCYPGGEYTNTNAKQTKKAGFLMARTVKTFSTTIGTKDYEMPTTVNAYDHYTDVLRVFKLVKYNPFNFLKLYLHWDLIAIEFFNQILEKGGVFHLWGHSWEIDNHKDWDRLEKVFKHIANRKDVVYLTNGELI